MIGVEPDAGPAAAVCRACRTRDCCRDEVALSGADVVRIARALQVPAEHFAALAPIAADSPPSPADIQLGASSARQRLVLVRRETEPGRGDAVCSFLLELRGGRRLCGLAELAPTACGLFPRDALGALHPDPTLGARSCWRSWRDDEAPRRAEAEAAAHAEAIRWHAIIAAWNAVANARAQALPTSTFLAHLFTAYAAGPA